VVLVPILTRRFDKKPTLIGCAALTIVNINTPIVLTLFDVSWFPEPGSTGLLLVLIISSGITTLLAPIVFATLNSMFGDIADEHELDVGERREGVIFAASWVLLQVLRRLCLRSEDWRCMSGIG
jgi:Na+/melibiose symporter-like transporter